MKRLLVVAAFAVAPIAWPAPRAQQTQIDALLAAIESSGCEFERNGTRHGAEEGAAHLRMKLDRAGDRVQTAREFIDRIAAGSSQSGRPYRVLCPERNPQRSKDWLDERLRALEAAGKK